MFGSSNGYFGTDGFFPSEGSNWDFMVLTFQMMFAATAATIVSGALAERIRFSAYVAAAVVITAVIYPVFGSWCWNENGWLAQRGFIDFAGSTLGVDDRIGSIMLNTHLSGAAGVVGFVLLKVLLGGKILMTDTVNGGLAGLVGITAGCATMNPLFAITTGLIAGGVCVMASKLCTEMKWDDAVGAVAVHGVCGAWGTLAAGIFYLGDIGNLERIQVQLIGIGCCFAWTFPVALITFKSVSLLTKLRCSTTEEQRGLDYSEHHEVGYPEFQPTLHA